MTLQALEFKPGISKDDTALANENGWIDADKVRFVGGRPEVIGGWDLATTGAFAGIARGAHAWSDLLGRRYVAWGTATKLYILAGGVIYDITPAGLPGGLVDTGGEPGGYGTNSYGASGYGTTVTSDLLPRVWHLDNWGQNLLALPRGGALYEWVPPGIGVTPSAATPVAGAPVRADAMFVTPERICVLIGTIPAGGTAYNAMTVRWSDQEDLNEWTPTALNLSGDYVLSQGSRAVSGLAARQQNLIWTDSALYTMQFTGDPNTVYGFNLAGTGCGLAGSLARTEHNGAAFWCSHSGFFVFQGAAPQPIPCTLRRDMIENVSPNQHEKISAGINPSFSEVWWLYPDKRDGNECSRYVLFNFSEQTWSSGTFDRSTFLSPSVWENPILFGTDGKVYFHEIGNTAVGGTITASLDSGYFDLDDGENLSIIRRLVPDFDDQVGPVDFTISTRAWPNSTAIDRGPYRASVDTEKIDLRVSARQMKLRLSSTSAPLFWRLGRLTIDIMKSGARR